MQAVEELTKQIDRELKAAAAKVDDFTAAQNAALSRAQQEHESVMLEAERKIQRLKLDEAAAQDRAGGLSVALAAERRALSDRQAELARLSAAAGALPGDVDAARAKEEAVKEQLAATRGEYEAREGEVRHQLNELTRGLAAFERLGLAFEKVGDDRVRLVFTALSDAAPAARASLAVHVTPDNAYVVSDVEPRMREGALEALVADLNAPDDQASFSRFVQLARREFKRAVVAAAAAAGDAGGTR